ncbi:allophanate hydrolase [Povalibacter sp.]|uniref:allophanate hydrolase n=1 Tax=Povalibacter sp. TaxID=1962978 RepID=UPI002F3EB4F0
MNTTPLTIESLLDAYRAGRTTPTDVIDDVLARIEAAPDRHVWITRLTREQVMSYVAALGSMTGLPLYGVPFAIKDNIDLAGVATTAGCPDFAHVPERSATVVQKLLDAGAIPIGKTNLDQFAAGLNGTRSPYGACHNSFDDAFVSGGSSSGSAVAVATGCVSFALGTDTAGSGRVPAGFNNIVGMKPSCGLLSTTGVLPACRSLDCVSIFAMTAADARRVLDVAEGVDAADAYSRELQSVPLPQAPRIGVPRADQREFFGDLDYARLFSLACERAAAVGGAVIEVDFAPLFETARLLYEGPWVAERYAAIESFLLAHPHSLHPVTETIVGSGNQPTAVAAFRAQYRLKELQRQAAALWTAVDVLMVPSAGTIYRIDEMLADPIRLNSNLGIYTNFVNLLDLAAIAVPAGFRTDGLPFGVTLIAPAGTDRALLQLGAILHLASSPTLGTSAVPVPDSIAPGDDIAAGYIAVALCGAHMSGLPLNVQLTQRKAHLLRTTRTAASYRFFAVPGGPPQRPGLVRVAQGGGAIDVEVWAVPQQHFGSFVAGIPSPLGIGKIELEDGSLCSGFLCESWAVDDAQEITALGSWRAFLKLV